MRHLEPGSAREAADLLLEAAQRKQRTATGGNFTKHRMAGPPDAGAELTIGTAKLNRVLQYEPADLTISVEAGLPWQSLTRVLAARGQMLPLDPPWPERCTVGGVIAANVCGPRRRQYGTARDLVIGMEFAMLNGRVVKCGGMVVKNVAGLDMGKLMIGSFGTLAVITMVNFKVVPMPLAERTFAIEFTTLAAAMAARDRLIRGVLQPGAIDLLNPPLAAEYGFDGYTLVIWFGGNEALMERCAREAVALGPAKTGDSAFWKNIGNLTPRFLDAHADGAVVRVSSSLTDVAAVLEAAPGPALSRAGNGVTYAYFTRSGAAARWSSAITGRDRKAVVEFAPDAARTRLALWPDPGTDFGMMEKIKNMFDPDRLLNRGRLYRHL